MSAVALAHLVERLDPGGFDVVGHELLDPRRERVGIRRQRRSEAIELGEPRGQRGQLLGPLELFRPSPDRGREEGRLAIEVGALDLRSRGRQRPQLRDPGGDRVPERRQPALGTRNGGRPFWPGTARDDGQMRAEEGVQERLAIERRSGEDDRPEDEVEEEEGLAQGGPARLVGVDVVVAVAPIPKIPLIRRGAGSPCQRN